MTTSHETTTEPTPFETASSSTKASPASTPTHRQRRLRAKAPARPSRTASVKELRVELDPARMQALGVDSTATVKNTIQSGLATCSGAKRGASSMTTRAI